MNVTLLPKNPVRSWASQLGHLGQPVGPGGAYLHCEKLVYVFCYRMDFSNPFDNVNAFQSFVDLLARPSTSEIGPADWASQSKIGSDWASQSEIGPDWANQSEFGSVGQNGTANQILSQIGSERDNQSEIGTESTSTHQSIRNWAKKYSKTLGPIWPKMTSVYIGANHIGSPGPK